LREFTAATGRNAIAAAGSSTSFLVELELGDQRGASPALRSAQRPVHLRRRRRGAPMWEQARAPGSAIAGLVLDLH
jgi:hypothetical protein